MVYHIICPWDKMLIIKNIKGWGMYIISIIDIIDIMYLNNKKIKSSERFFFNNIELS